MRFVSGGASAGVAVAALALTLAGCVGDPAPIVTRTPSGVPTVVGTPTSTPSPSPTALSNDELFAMMPDGADREDLYGAMVTAQFFLEQYSVMFQTGDTRVWEALSDPGCGYCADALENARRVRDEGWVAEGGEITIATESVSAQLLDDGGVHVALPADVANAYVVDADGDRSEVEPAGVYVFELRIARVDGVWAVQGVAPSELA